MMFRTPAIAFVPCVSLVAVVASVACALVLAGCTSDPPASAAAPDQPPIIFLGGRPSVDALLDEFLSAVERKDLAALHKLRVTREEYLEIIVPGMVEKGQPPRRVSEEPREFFWKLLDRKSQYAAEAIVERYGGRHYVSRSLRYSKGSNEYAWYRTHGQVRLDLVDADAEGPFELRTGPIAEVAGQYKFIAFNWDD